MFERSKKQELKLGLQFSWEDVPMSSKAYVEDLLKWKGDGFDTRTHIVDPKTGALLAYQPYRRVCDGSDTYYLRQDAGGIERRFSEQGEILNPDPAKKPEHKNVDKRISA